MDDFKLQMSVFLLPPSLAEESELREEDFFVVVTSARILRRGNRNFRPLLRDHNSSITENTLISFYKHQVYKHAQPQIFEKSKHNAKHAPG